MEGPQLICQRMASCVRGRGADGLELSEDQPWRVWNIETVMRTLATRWWKRDRYDVRQAFAAVKHTSRRGPLVIFGRA